MPELTVKQVADQLLMSAFAVRMKIHDGQLAARRNEAGDFRITPEAVARYAEARKSRPHGMTRVWDQFRELRRQAAEANQTA